MGELLKVGDKVVVVEVYAKSKGLYEVGETGTIVGLDDSAYKDWIDVDFGNEIHTLYTYEAKLVEPVIDLSNKKINVKKYADEQGITLEQANKEIQTWLFEQGFTWISGDEQVLYADHTDALFTREDKKFGKFSLQHHCASSEKEELTFTVERSVKLSPHVVEKPTPVETVELGGKVYNKKELEEALAKIKPLEE